MVWSNRIRPVIILLLFATLAVISPPRTEADWVMSFSRLVRREILSQKNSAHMLGSLSLRY